MNESELWAKMRAGLKEYGIFHRVENLVGEGTPDVAWASWPSSGWFELKVVNRGNQINFRPRQVPWMMDWVQAGGRGHIIVFWRGCLCVFEGRDAEKLNEEGLLGVPPVASFSWPVNWLRVRDVLKTTGRHARALVSEQRQEVPQSAQGDKETGDSWTATRRPRARVARSAKRAESPNVSGCADRSPRQGLGVATG